MSPGHEVATGEKNGTDSQGGGRQGRRDEGKPRQKVGWGRGEKKLDLAAHLLTGQPNPQWRLQPSGSLCEEGLGVGIRHTCQAGISALTQQEGILPAQWLLQQSEGAVEVGELSARGRGCCCWGWAQGGVYGEGGRAQAGLCLPYPIPRYEARPGKNQTSGQEQVSAGPACIDQSLVSATAFINELHLLIN